MEVRTTTTGSRDVVLQALRRTRQVRSFTNEPVSDEDLHAILEVARWTGSSMNTQPWQFIVIRDADVRRRIGEISVHARYVAKAPLAMAIAMPGEDSESDAYDEGRVAERILIAASAMDLGAGIGWIEEKDYGAIRDLLGVTAPAFVRTVVSIGHPSEEARKPRTGPRTGRRPLEEFVRER
ncbi:MAG: nitroreductase family protein [Chloroflexota bacterium]|jgi:nitroreductase